MGNNDFYCIENSGYANLTKGKVYNAKSWESVKITGSSKIRIVDDSGKENIYPMFLFGKSDEWREEVLKKLL